MIWTMSFNNQLVNQPMSSNKPHIRKISGHTWICFDNEGTGIGSTMKSCWLDYYLKTHNY